MPLQLVTTHDVQSPADENAMWVDFFDNFINGLPDFTTGPGDQAYKRRYSYTYSDNILNPGVPITHYGGFDWKNTNPTTESYTTVLINKYTTTPGDLTWQNDFLDNAATSTAFDLIRQAGKWRFWQSDIVGKTNGFLLTCGSWPVLYFHGGTDAYMLTDLDWEAGLTPNTQRTNVSQSVIAQGAENSIMYTGAPYYSMPASPGLYSVGGIGMTGVSTGYTGTQHTQQYIDEDPADSTIYYPMHQSFSYSGSSDFRWIDPHTKTATGLPDTADDTYVKLLVNGTDYYLTPSDTGRTRIAFYFGTVDPDFTL